jgi:hypothetical protein
VGNVTIGPAVALQCPVASAFVDSLGGLYGPGAYIITSGACSVASAPAQQTSFEVLVSSLQFQCNPCGPGFYSLDAGASNGSTVTNITCLPCPSGGACTNGSVLATPGYWGAAGTANLNKVVTMAECPPGYCCSGTSAAPCSAVDSCVPSRTGSLCSDCVSGFVEGLGSATCTPLGDCSRDTALVWPVLVGAVFASGVVQLTVVSGVWLVHGRATGKMKSVIFFVQVGTNLVVGTITGS